MYDEKQTVGKIRAPSGHSFLDKRKLTGRKPVTSVFSVPADWLILHRSLEAREFFGCALIFSAIVLVQLPQKTTDKKM